MSKKNQKEQQGKDCYNCGECQYVGEGGYACMAEEPKIVLEDHIPDDDFYWCGGRLWKRD